MTADKPTESPLSLTPLITVAELATTLQVSADWLYDQVNANAIPHVRLGKNVRFRPEAIAEWLNSIESS
jgi:excisionase family DNA binding protein